MSVYNIDGYRLSAVYGLAGNRLGMAYNISGEVIFPDSPVLPVPSGNLNASLVVPLPDLYETGKGFTCTGLAYDATNNTFLIGDIGLLLPNNGAIKSQIVRVSADFQTVVETIPLHHTFSGMGDVQGVTIDTSDRTIWFCAPSVNKIYHTNALGENLGSISTTRPTGIAYSSADDSFWVLNYSNQILHIDKDGTVLETFASTFEEALDQCFLDESHGYLYITAGANYSERNNVYLFNISTHEQSVACTVDSYSVEGIWIGTDKMVIVNDGYYHSALVPVNQANIYTLTN